MTISRRRLIGSAAAVTVAAGFSWSRAFAQTIAAPPPIVFAHGNGDHAPIWMTTLWRMESNGIPPDRMLAINFTDPLARSDDAVAQKDRSSTEDQRNEFARAVAGLRQRTGAARVAAIGNSRGGYPIRSYVAGGPRISATPCFAAFPITEFSTGRIPPATNSTAADLF